MPPITSLLKQQYNDAMQLAIAPKKHNVIIKTNRNNLQKSFNILYHSPFKFKNQSAFTSSSR